LLKLSSNANECKPLVLGPRSALSGVRRVIRQVGGYVIKGYEESYRRLTGGGASEKLGTQPALSPNCLNDPMITVNTP
jgi:hypothetical protein